MIDTSAQIMEAARQLLLAEGAAAVSMRRVATMVGVTPMTIYRHFDNREALLMRVADESLQEFAQRWADRPLPDDFDQWGRELLDEHLDFALQQPHLYDFVFMQTRPGARQYPEDFRAARSPTLNLLADGITEGMRRGLVRQDDAWEIALTVAALLHGLIALYRGGRIGLSEQDFRALCHKTMGRVFDGLRD